jgi:hypothetical protein
MVVTLSCPVPIDFLLQSQMRRGLSFESSVDRLALESSYHAISGVLNFDRDLGYDLTP